MYEAHKLEQPRAVYENEFLTGVDFPVGPIAGGTIRLNGKAERVWWQIFDNHEQRQGTGFVPNSFFAIRTQSGTDTQVRALQTEAVGPFQAMDRLTFSAEFPFGWYFFEDAELPVEVSMEVYNPLIPMEVKKSAIPTAFFRFTVTNPSEHPVDVSLLSTQQNAVGYSGYDAIEGALLRENPGFGDNYNRVINSEGRTAIAMTGAGGSLHLSADTAATATAAWADPDALLADFSANGGISGPAIARSPAPQTTVDGALAAPFTLAPGEEKTVTFALSWYFADGDHGCSQVEGWNFLEAGNQYQNWFANAAEVDAYVAEHFDHLDALTRLYHQTFYASNLPRYALDRISSNLSVLKSPTVFWTKDGYFGMWESTSDRPVWAGNVTHVLHYAQSHARLFPEIGRIMRDISLNSQTRSGFIPDRDSDHRRAALDGHFGTILSVYREHLLSPDGAYLESAWPRTRLAMNHAISRFDPEHTGMLHGSYHNTLDCNSSGTTPWMGTLYSAALLASERMADIMGEPELARKYAHIAATAREAQNAALWNEELGYYIEKPQNLPDTRITGDGSSIDMFLGQWWANQLNLGQIYPVDRTLAGLEQIFTRNRFTDPGEGYPAHFRDFLGTGDTGWQMLVFNEIPCFEIVMLYYEEVMSGFEYAFAATMMQYGMIEEGLEVVREISKRYDGRHRGADEVSTGSNATVDGTGSPVGEDECGKFYVRPMSNWSTLLALQGFSYDGPQQQIGFNPRWQPEEHTSFFAGAEGWGLYTQARDNAGQSSRIILQHGTLPLSQVTLGVAKGSAPSTVKVTLNGESVSTKWHAQDDDTVRIEFPASIALEAAQTLEIHIY